MWKRTLAFREIPACGNMTALNIWFVFCIHFVFWAFFGYTYLLCRIRPAVLWRKKGRRETRQLSNKTSHVRISTYI